MTLLLTLLLVAQTPPPPAQPPAGQPPAPTAPPASNAPPAPNAPPTPPPNYSYSAEGRRDPFLSLINRGTSDTRAAQAGRTRPDGIAGILVDEVAVRGIVRSRGSWVAMIAAPNGRTYTIRAGDKLLDGSVRTISAEAVVLLQEVNDPLSLEKQREVRKYLRGEVK